MDTPVYGKQKLDTGNSKYNSMSFVIEQALSKLNVATLVQVVAVYPGATSPVGTVDVLPLVNQVAGDGTAIPHTTVYGLPYFRYQGGINAVLIDPHVNDIGYCIFADRDIGSVKETFAAAPPSSERRFDMADGLYIGGWCGNLAPTNYVQVTDGAINIITKDSSTPVNIVLGGPGGATSAKLTNNLLTVNANLKVNGTAEVAGDTKLDSTLEVTSNTTVGGNVAVAGGMAVSGGGSGGTSSITGTFTLTGTFTATGEIKSGSHTLTQHTHTDPQGGNTGLPTG